MDRRRFARFVRATLLAVSALAAIGAFRPAHAAPLTDQDLQPFFVDAQDATRAAAAEAGLRQLLAQTEDPVYHGMIRYLITVAKTSRKAPVDELLGFADSSLALIVDRKGARTLVSDLVIVALLDRGERLDVADSLLRANKDPKDDRAPLLHARIHLARGLPDSAVALLAPLVAGDRDAAEPAVWLGRAYERLGRSADAIDAYVQAVGNWQWPDSSVLAPLRDAWSATGGAPDSLEARLKRYRRASYRRVVFEKPAVDRRMPRWSCPKLAGGWMRSRDLAGRITVIDFWGTSCAVCIESMHEFQRFAAEEGSERVVFLTVDREYDSSRGTLARSRALVRDSAWAVPTLYDSSGALWRAFGVKWTPTTALVDARGRIRYVNGTDTEHRSYARKQLAALLEEEKARRPRR